MQASRYFAVEIGWIKHPAMREFAEKYVDLFPPYFMVNPASSTGKYHAPWSNIKGSDSVAGGLARHVKVMCKWVKDLSDAYMLTSDQADAALLATLGHDAVKYGFAGGKYTTRTHESEGAIFFKRCVQKLAATFPHSEEIYNAIAFHQGRWAMADPPKRFPEDFDRIGQLVHVADMCASRQGISYDCINEEQESLIG